MLPRFTDLYKTQRKYGENAQILVKWAFSSFWSRFWPMTHQRFFHHQFLSFSLAFLQKAKKFGTFVVTNVNIQIANYSCTLLYRKYCRNLVLFFVVKPVFVKVKNISQHEAAASFEISQI